MDVGLSDLLTCPRCGPGYGLVLLPYEASDRRVRTGVLGCANCRERYPVEEGVADLRVPRAGAGGSGGGPDEEFAVEPGRPDRAGGADETGGADEADGAGAAGEPAGESAAAGTEAGSDPVVRLAALMDLAQATGTVVLAGPGTRHAASLSALVEGVEVVAVLEGSSPPPVAGVTWIRVTDVLPFQSSSLRAVALTGRRGSLLEEAARVVGGSGRLVLDPAPEAVRARLQRAGFSVLAAEAGVVVAAPRP